MISLRFTSAFVQEAIKVIKPYRMRVYKLNKLLTEETAQPDTALFDLKGNVSVCMGHAVLAGRTVTGT